MINKELPSGAVLGITPLDFQSAWHVTQAVTKEIKQLDLDVKALNLESMASLDIQNIPVDFILGLKDPICSLLASQKINEAVDKCFDKCTYNNVRMSKQTFENREARKDYLFAAFYVLWENAAPFFEGLSSISKTS